MDPPCLIHTTLVPKPRRRHGGSLLEPEKSGARPHGGHPVGAGGRGTLPVGRAAGPDGAASREDRESGDAAPGIVDTRGGRYIKFLNISIYFYTRYEM